MIWGMTLHPGEEWTRKIYHQEYLTIASLECRPDKSNGEANPNACLMIKTDDNEHVLCTLEKGLTPQQKLDLILQQRETVTFIVQGTGTVYLTGYTLEGSISQEDGRMGYDGAGHTIRGTPERHTPDRGHSTHPGRPSSHRLKNQSMGSTGKSTGAHGSSAVHMPGYAGLDMTIGAPSDNFAHGEQASTSHPGMMYNHPEQSPALRNNMVSPVSSHVLTASPSSENQYCVVADIGDMSTASKGSTPSSAPQLSPLDLKGHYPGGMGPASQSLSHPMNPYGEPDQHYPAVNQSGVSPPWKPYTPSTVTMTKTEEVKVKKSKARPKTLKCKFCNKLFAEKFNLTNHVRIHTGEKPYQCGFCDKAFAAKGNLRIHERIHTGVKPFKCSFCEKSFAQVGSLRGHERTHTGEKPYQCQHCPRAFAVKNNLRMHLKVHELKPFKCPHCNKAFAEERALDDHMVTHEEHTTDSTEEMIEATAEATSEATIGLPAE